MMKPLVMWLKLLLFEDGMFVCEVANSRMAPNVNLCLEDNEHFGRSSHISEISWILNYLTITRPDIAFSASAVSWFMYSPHTSRWIQICRL